MNNAGELPSLPFPGLDPAEKTHIENAPTILGGCITKRLLGYRFDIRGFRFVDSPFVVF